MFIKIVMHFNVCTISVENSYLVLKVVFYFELGLVVFIRARSTTFICILSFDCACMSMVPNMTKGYNFLAHSDLVGTFPNIYTLM